MLNNKGTKVIETERLILRPFKKDDGKDMFENWANDDRVTKYLRWNTHENVNESYEICSMWEEESKKINNYQWAIVCKKTNKVIGSIGLVDLNEKMLCGEVGYAIGYNYWGKGTVKEALLELIKYFKEIGLVRLQAYHEVENINSDKVLIKSGFEYEGTLRKSVLNKRDELVDAKIYSIILN